MKKHQLILVSTAIFTLLFYKEGIGLNLALFSLLLIGLIIYQTTNKSLFFKLLTGTALLSACSFAWYGDIASFIAVFLSLVFLQFQNKDSQIKLIQTIPIVIINAITSIGRPFIFSQWFPKTKIGNDTAKKIIAYFLIPTLFIVVFFVAYSFGSDTFSSLFIYELDIDLWQLILISLLGFYISFSFWNYFVPEYSNKINVKLENDFSSESKDKNNRSFSFLDLEFERKSGEISLILLNIMLLVFIVTYNYEQFFKVETVTNLSVAIHDRVNAVIISIIMAVGVILFYFKGGFNFDTKATLLKLLAKIWIGLNGILIISSAIKNSEYIMQYGLTYKRLGVYAFLGITLSGLIFTYFKIKKQKTNAYLFNQMVLCLYGLVLLCAFFNWGNLITTYNIKTNKGVDAEFLSDLNFNDEARRAYFIDQNLNGDYNEVYREKNIYRNQNEHFLSKTLYYESIPKIKVVPVQKINR
ncbi:DUF4173 domain-containing protein [Flavobacterium sp. PL002]|uniref:DUF4153 domain-containing protein n=1 Tax=Flavobacterium sp. PL002 TaxID=1897058 RepID=UPI001787E05E|nr:DUF4173 domain-containing protein [Flavobacterium sp. PL002]MBE0392350.1 hypothetical protein [Flavobacterium sp. PL002]